MNIPSDIEFVARKNIVKKIIKWLAVTLFIALLIVMCDKSFEKAIKGVKIFIVVYIQNS